MNLKGVPTTISVGSNGQLLVTFPKSVAKIWGIGKGTKIIWKIDEKTGKPIGKVII